MGDQVIPLKKFSNDWLDLQVQYLITENDE